MLIPCRLVWAPTNALPIITKDVWEPVHQWHTSQPRQLALEGYPPGSDHYQRKLCVGWRKGTVTENKCSVRWLNYLCKQQKIHPSFHTGRLTRGKIRSILEEAKFIQIGYDPHFYHCTGEEGRNDGKLIGCSAAYSCLLNAGNVSVLPIQSISYIYCHEIRPHICSVKHLFPGLFGS